jgi:hypothetical protein
MRKYTSGPKVETATVKGGIRLKYIPGDTTPPSAIRRCHSCGETYEAVKGRTCGCFQRDYAAFKAKEGK